MSRGEPVAPVIGRVTRRVVEVQVVHVDVGTAGDGEEVNRPVLDLEVLDHAGLYFAEDNEVVGPEFVNIAHSRVGSS